MPTLILIVNEEVNVMFATSSPNKPTNPQWFWPAAGVTVCPPQPPPLFTSLVAITGLKTPFTMSIP